MIKLVKLICFNYIYIGRQNKQAKIIFPTYYVFEPLKKKGGIIFKFDSSII